FGNRHFAPEGKSATIADARTGAEADPVIVDRATGTPIREPEFAWVPGPAAGERTRQRYARRAMSPGSAGGMSALPKPGLKRGRDAHPAESKSTSADRDRATGGRTNARAAARKPSHRSDK